MEQKIFELNILHDNLKSGLLIYWIHHLPFRYFSARMMIKTILMYGKSGY